MAVIVTLQLKNNAALARLLHVAEEQQLAVDVLESVRVAPTDVQGQDDDYPRKKWQQAVHESKTNLGYWDWVERQRAADDEAEAAD
jgi:hypothetical protein